MLYLPTKVTMLLLLTLEPRLQRRPRALWAATVPEISGDYGQRGPQEIRRLFVVGRGRAQTSPEKEAGQKSNGIVLSDESEMSLDDEESEEDDEDSEEDDYAPTKKAKKSSSSRRKGGRNKSSAREPSPTTRTCGSRLVTPRWSTTILTMTMTNFWRTRMRTLCRTHTVMPLLMTHTTTPPPRPPRRWIWCWTIVEKKATTTRRLQICLTPSDTSSSTSSGRTTRICTTRGRRTIRWPASRESSESIITSSSTCWSMQSCSEMHPRGYRGHGAATRARTGGVR